MRASLLVAGLMVGCAAVMPVWADDPPSMKPPVVIVPVGGNPPAVVTTFSFGGCIGSPVFVPFGSQLRVVFARDELPPSGDAPQLDTIAVVGRDRVIRSVYLNGSTVPPMSALLAGVVTLGGLGNEIEAPYTVEWLSSAGVVYAACGIQLVVPVNPHPGK